MGSTGQGFHHFVPNIHIHTHCISHGSFSAFWDYFLCKIYAALNWTKLRYLSGTYLLEQSAHWEHIWLALALEKIYGVM